MELSPRRAQPKQICWYCDTPEDLPAPYGNGRVEDKDPEDIVDGLGTDKLCCRDCYRRGGRWRDKQRKKRSGAGSGGLWLMNRTWRN